MTSTQRSMDLQLPPRQQPVSGSRDIRPKMIEEWINGLPLANLGETSRQVYELLTEINALAIARDDRLRVLEQLRPTVHYIADALRKHYIGHPFPLTLKARKVAYLTREILAAMATGYKIIITETAASPTNGGRSEDKVLLTALHRALRYLGNVLLKTYQVYDPYPPGLWHELHTLFDFAERNGLHLAPVTDHEYVLIEASSVSDVYKQILLLALACPYRLRQGEVEQVEQALERWSGYALIAPQGQDNAQALFAINPQHDESPTYRVLHDRIQITTCRLLDTQGLTHVLREEMLQTRESPISSTLGFSAREMWPDIMRRLTLAWGVIPKRRFTRTKKFAQVQVSMGLTNAHFFISHEADFNAELGDHNGTGELTFQNRAQFKSSPIAAEIGKLPEHWELGSAGTVDWTTKSTPAAAPPPEASAAPSKQLWKMVNISAGGYCLLWDNASATQAQVGELVCLQETDSRHMDNWGIGVIRWMKSASGDGLELGVQMLAPNAVAVAVKTSKDGQRFSDYQRCLLLPEIGPINQPATLLLPALTAQVGGAAIINIHGKEHVLELTKMLENTGTFGQFHFAPSEQQPARSSAASAAELKDFNSIWSSI